MTQQHSHIDSPFLRLQQANTWVIKIGSSSILGEDAAKHVRIDTHTLTHLAEQIAQLKNAHKRVVLITSGAVALGADITNTHPHALYQKQACAAVGQGALMGVYKELFSKHDIRVAQLLLTESDWANRTRYLNMRNTINGLLEWDIVPIINENDTVATEALSLGDNDTLAALVAQLINAELLVLLTDTNGIYTKNPKKNKDATAIAHMQANDPLLDTIAEKRGSKVGKGGMYSKVMAARKAAFSGTSTVITNAKQANVLHILSQGYACGTLLTHNAHSMLDAREQWIHNQLSTSGTLIVDDGAVTALKNNSSLLAVGIRRIEGTFHRGDVVLCANQNNMPVARGIVNYNSDQLARIQGLSSTHIRKLLGTQAKEPYVIHADKIVLLQQ